MANSALLKDWYTNPDEFHDIYTITLAELIEMGFFDWDAQLFDWKSAAYSDEQYKRICQQFVDRYYWREIGIIPPLQWAQQLVHKLKNEVMPKYRPLYAKIDEGLNWFADSDEFSKSRVINSGFPETMLSGSEVYASTGTDQEGETIKEGATLDKYVDFAEKFVSIDKLVLDELECMFSGLWTTNMNGW